MRRFVMMAILFAVAAGPALAHVPPGSLIYATGSKSTTDMAATTDGFVVPEVIGDSPSAGSHGPSNDPTPRPAGYGPPLPASPATQPVPEPGTMALASMGLLALGATLRRRHRRGR